MKQHNLTNNNFNGVVLLVIVELSVLQEQLLDTNGFTAKVLEGIWQHQKLKILS